MSNRRKILFVWTGVTSYMADCWRALSRYKDVEVKVIIDRTGTIGSIAFDETTVLGGLDYVLVDGRVQDARNQLEDWMPDVVFIVGWHSSVSRAFAQSVRYAAVPKVLVFDMPWEWRLRKFAARFVLARYLRHFMACYVPGMRAQRYARWLGFDRQMTFTGLFSVKAPSEDWQGAETPDPFFLYVGRLSPEKRIRKLARSYLDYRKRCEGKPWKLVCCGMGVERHCLEGLKGVDLRGFLQPNEVHALQRQAGALVLTSSFDPWPLVILESVSVGLPIICTPVCGNHVELVGDNGIVTNDTTAAMLEMTNNYGHYRVAAKAAVSRARPYWSEAWASRTRQLVETVLAKSGGCQV